MKVNILSYLLAVIFIVSGGAKVAGLEFEIVAFERWGYPLWFMYFTGVAEVAGAVALLINKLGALPLRKLAAPALSLLMIGAIVTHIIHAEWPILVIAVVIFVMAVLLSVELWRKPPQGKNTAKA